ncbi:MAG: hypothetical protein COB53_05145 [Elusimicrobia bacterium]|nr:MAG: hypothetical protein COB53_05145 [Elusimicrobiota bacterium]
MSIMKRASGWFPPFSAFAVVAGFVLLFAACDDGSLDEPLPDFPDTDIEVQTVGPGEHCLTTIDCSGSGTCQNNFCTGSNLAPGLHCRSSGDCAGTSICAGDVCSATDAHACVNPGRHCDTSGDCCGGSTCDNGHCRSGSSLGRGLHCETSSDCEGVLTCVTAGSGPNFCY